MSALPLRVAAAPVTPDDTLTFDDKEMRPISAEILRDTYRHSGYLRAAINPLERVAAGEQDRPSDAHERRLWEAYCGGLALNASHLRDRAQQAWLFEQFEAMAEVSDAVDLTARRLSLYRALLAAERFEHQVARVYAAQKHFSLEGLEAYIPFLTFGMAEAAALGVKQVVMGMPHRGRMNVLRNVMGLSPEEMTALYTDTPLPHLPFADIKDHLGVTRVLSTPNGDVRTVLASNPSHLEAVTPVIAGMARALQDDVPASLGRDSVLPIIVHGDAAFCGQGIVTETLNLARTRGYGLQGIVHVLLNNQIGSTISHRADARSTLHSADIARGYDLPILHANADTPEAVVRAAELAVAFRQRFHHDILVDIVGYRRKGHFGHDDPTCTQPAMQRVVQAKPTAVVLYRQALIEGHGIDAAQVEQIEQAVEADQGLDVTPFDASGQEASAAGTGSNRAGTTKTAVTFDRLRAHAQTLCRVPEGFALHRDVAALLGRWQQTLADAAQAVDWNLSEALAFASLLADGHHVRLTGLDIGRGSFFHRYCVWHNQTADTDGEDLYVPLRHLQPSQGSFAVFDTPLSEEAVLGFEYGYSLQTRDTLVLWEAQFGDFVNNAQVIIDQFIATGESKWGNRSRLVVLLPHGYEGGGPEHSSAYLGRFLSLCAEQNMAVAMPSTSAQMFHLLRRQALQADARPLIVFTPKWELYGCKASHATWAAFERDRFENVMEPAVVPASVERLLLCSGKVAHAVEERLAALPEAAARMTVARVEQLYPFPGDEVRALLSRLSGVREVMWVQEEPRNHGAWPWVREWLEGVLPASVQLRCAARPAAASCATIGRRRHLEEMAELLDLALGA